MFKPAANSKALNSPAARRYGATARDESSSFKEIEHYVNESFEAPKSKMTGKAKKTQEIGVMNSSITRDIEMKDLRSVGHIDSAGSSGTAGSIQKSGGVAPVVQPATNRKHKEHRSSVNRTTDFPPGFLKSSLNIDRKEPITRI